MSEYNMPPIDLFGKRCRIKHVSDLERGFVYRIVNSGVRSNCWKELPLGRYGNEPIRHDYMEDIVYVVCDTMIDEMSKIEPVALKDIEIMHGWIYCKDRLPKLEENEDGDIESDYVLVIDKGKEYDVCKLSQYKSGEKFWRSYMYDMPLKLMVAWMPLPEWEVEG